MTEQYPPNPMTRRTTPARQQPETRAPEPQKKVERITTGKVVMRKQPWHKRWAEKFFGGSSISDVAEYMVGDVLIPAARATIVDAFTGGIERAVFGEARPASRRGFVGGGNVPYNRFGSPSGANVRGNAPSGPDVHRLRTQEWKEIILSTHAEAESTLQQLYDLALRYPAATVADLYEMIGTSAPFTLERWGWTADMLEGVRITRVRLEHGQHGYLLELPNPVPIS